jgi:DNA-binding MarR family transcriptional regulator
MSAASPARDPEARLHAAHHEALRIWLRLFTCTQLVERVVRARLREQFGTTLPRFDLMAQLERHPQGLRMGELSERLLVTGGNVTGITNQLVAERLVARHAIAGDRRAHAVRLTARGRRMFATMARAHEAWIIELLAALPPARTADLYALLGTLKRGLQARPTDSDVPVAVQGRASARPQRRRRRDAAG